MYNICFLFLLMSQIAFGSFCREDLPSSKEQILEHLQPQMREALQETNDKIKMFNDLLKNSNYEHQINKWDWDSINLIKDVIFKPRKNTPPNDVLNHSKNVELRNIVLNSIDNQSHEFKTITSPIFKSHIERLFKYTRDVIESDEDQNELLSIRLREIETATQKSFEKDSFDYRAYIYLSNHLSLFMNTKPNFNAEEGEENSAYSLIHILQNPFTAEIYSYASVSQYYKNISQYEEWQRVSEQTISYLINNHANKDHSAPIVCLNDFNEQAYIEAMITYDYYPIGLSGSIMTVDGAFMYPTWFNHHDKLHYADNGSLDLYKSELKSLMKRIDQLQDSAKKRRFTYFMFDFVHENLMENPALWNPSRIIEKGPFLDKIDSYKVYFRRDKVDDLMSFGFLRDALSPEVQKKFNKGEFEEGFSIYLDEMLEFFEFVKGQ